jgi:hypothetical protein
MPNFDKARKFITPQNPLELGCLSWIIILLLIYWAS